MDSLGLADDEEGSPFWNYVREGWAEVKDAVGTVVDILDRDSGELSAAQDRYVENLENFDGHVASNFSTYVPSENNDALREGLGGFEHLLVGHEELEMMADHTVFLSPFFTAANMGFYAAEGNWGGAVRQGRNIPS